MCVHEQLGKRNVRAQKQQVKRTVHVKKEEEKKEEKKEKKKRVERAVCAHEQRGNRTVCLYEQHGKRNVRAQRHQVAVSYTHLTLPTRRTV